MAVSVPADAGVNVMVFVQLAPAVSGLGHVDAVFAKELAPEPVIVVEAVNETEDEVLFLRVITWVAADVPTVVEGNVSEDGVMVRPVVPLVPVPDSATVCGEPVALSGMEREAGREPAAVGLNSTEIVQFAETANDVVQVVADFR